MHFVITNLANCNDDSISYFLISTLVHVQGSSKGATKISLTNGQVLEVKETVGEVMKLVQRAKQYSPMSDRIYGVYYENNQIHEKAI